jgi:serine/threonine-protein kinase
MIEFRTLGTLDLRHADGRELHSLLAQPKRIALLAYLCLAIPRGFHRRDTLLELFWPDSDQAHARTSLRNALHVLRRTLGEAAILSRGDEEVAINFDSIWCDSVAFEIEITANKAIDALEIYRGDLLPGFFIDEAPHFEKWLDGERNRLRSVSAGAARVVAETREAEHNLTDAVRWARRAVELADSDERAVRRLVELLARAGDHAGALHVYDSFAAQVAAELGAEPSEETRALAESLRSRRVGTVKDSFQSSRPGDASGMIGAAKAADPSEKIAGNRIAHGAPWSVRSPKFRVAILGILAAIVLGFGLARPFDLPVGRPPTERTKLTFNGKAIRASLSPDGQFLAYVVWAGDSLHLVVQDLTGGPADTIMTYNRSPADNIIEWSPDGSRLLVKVPRKVVLVHRRGGHQEIVPHFKPGDNPHWLPDGLRVSLSDIQSGRLVIVDLKSGNAFPIPVSPSKLLSFDGAWSPDGRVFAVLIDSPDSGRWMIRTIGLDGRTEDVVEDSVLLNSPRWSGDGNALYYLRGSDAIWRVPVSTRTGKATGGPEQIQSGIGALPGNIGIMRFSLSRNGRKLVYARGETFSNIYRIDATGAPTRPRMERLTTGTAFRWSPVVSPDGQWIAFAAQIKDGAELFRMPITGGPATPITSGAAVWPGSQIAWSPDGSRIAFQSVRAGRSHIWVATVSTGELRGFSGTSTSRRTAHLTWAPGSRIAYQVPRTYIRALDPVTGDDVLLVRDTADAWFHFPSYSPDGQRIAMVRYHQPERSLISIIRISDGAETRLPTGLLFPLGWDASGRYVLAQVPSQTKVVRVDALGKKPTETVFTAPAPLMECGPAGARQPQTFICAMFDFVSDIWLIENFDRHAR